MKKHIFHAALVCIECLILVTAIFSAYTARLRLHDRVYTDTPQELRFAVAQGQDVCLRDLDCLRVDYTTHSRPIASDDTDFIAGQMIRIPKNLADPYAEYRIKLPPDVFKVRINTHYQRGKEHPSPLKMQYIVWGNDKISEDELVLYHNRRFNFYGQCYIPNPFMNGYGIEYAFVVGITILVSSLVSFLRIVKRFG